MSLGSTLSKTIWPFSPQSIPNLLLWVDAADTTSYTPSTAITTCRNKGYSSGSLSVTGTVNATSTTINSLPTFAFAASAFMVCPSLVFLQTTRTAFVVVNIGASGTIRYFMVGGSNSLDTQFYSYSTDLELNYSGHNNYVAASPSPMFSTTSLLCATTLSTNGGLFINGTAQTLTTNTPLAYATGTSTTQQLGASGTGTFTLGEAMIFDGAITDIQRQHIEGYLAKKWGLQALLPASHPYYNNATWGVSHPFNRTFSPPDISGCKLWLDGADSASITLSGSNVTAWADKSGNASNATATGTAGGITTSSAGVVFSGGASWMTIAGIAGTLTNTPFVVFVVETFTGNFASKSWFFGDDANTGVTDSTLTLGYRQGTGAANGHNGAYSMSFWADDLDDLNFTASSPTGVTRLWSNYLPTATNRNVRLNGAVDATHTNFTRLNAFATPVLGRANGLGYYYGTISEIIIYNQDIGVPQIQQVEQYLAWKWKLVSNLVPGHPGKTLPAFQTMFSPKSITGLSLWLDAADTLTITLSGSNVTVWKDKSGSGYSAVPNSGTVTQTTLNGNNVVNFGTAVMRADNFVWSSSFTQIFVGYVATGDIIIDTLSGAYGDYVYTGNGALMNINTYATNSGVLQVNDSVAGSVAPKNTWFIFSIGYGSTGTAAINYTLNGTVRTTTVFAGSGGSATNAALPLYIGGATAAFGTGVQFAELIHFNVAISTSQRQQVEGYLARKWGLLANLPSTHAYNKIKP